MRNIALALLLAAAPAAALAGSGALPVTVNEAVRITLPEPAHDVIIGNPAVADVTVSDSRHLIVTGKAFGQTNLIVTSLDGQTIFDREVVVPTPATGRVTMITGGTLASFACAPECMATATPDSGQSDDSDKPAAAGPAGQAAGSPSH